MFGIFRIRNVITALKGAVVGFVFAVVYFIYNLIGSWVSTTHGAGFWTAIAIFVLGVLTWGWLANVLWGWE